MKKLLYNKKTYIFVILSCFIILVYIFFSFSDVGIDNIVYGVEKAESSTSTNTQATGTNMVELLARLINGESRGEPYEGQVAVGAVIMNRVKNANFPNTIAGVIYQKGQFSCVTDGQFDVAIEENSTVYKAAQEAMNGADPTNGALYFYNPNKTKSKWLFSLKTTLTIGEHVFALGET